MRMRDCEDAVLGLRRRYAMRRRFCFPGALGMIWALLGTAACGRGAIGNPLVLVADVDLPGKAVRFDYEDIDAALGHLVIAHMNDASVLVVNLSDGSVVKLLPNIPVARGVIIGDDVGRIFVTSSPAK